MNSNQVLFITHDFFYITVIRLQIISSICSIQVKFNYYVTVEQPFGSYEHYGVKDPSYKGINWKKLSKGNEKPETGLNRGSGSDSGSGSDKKYGGSDGSSESGSRSGSDSSSESDKKNGKRLGSRSDDSSESGSRSGSDSSSGSNRKYRGRFGSGSDSNSGSGERYNRRNNRKYRGSSSGRSSEGSGSGSTEDTRASKKGSSERDRGNLIYDNKAGGPYFYKESKSSQYPGIRVVEKYGAMRDNGGMFYPRFDWPANWGGFGDYGGGVFGNYDYSQYSNGAMAEQNWLNMINNYRF